MYDLNRKENLLNKSGDYSKDFNENDINDYGFCKEENHKNKKNEYYCYCCFKTYCSECVLSGLSNIETKKHNIISIEQAY